MYTVLGLGNPGSRYENTRHNIGHMVISELANRIGVQLSRHKQSGTYAASARIGMAPGELGEQVILAISQGYMNTTGGPTASLLAYFNASPKNLIVIHDDLDLPFSTLKLKRGGGEGGHNGLKSISQSLGTRDYIRLRFGIGRPPARQDPADYVLGAFTSAERKELGLLISQAADAVEDVMLHGLEQATMRLHSARQ